MLAIMCHGDMADNLRFAERSLTGGDIIGCLETSHLQARTLVTMVPKYEYQTHLHTYGVYH